MADHPDGRRSSPLFRSWQWIRERSAGLGRPIRRFVVADRSMEPTLVAGQGLVGVRWPRATVGQLRCVEHPQRPGFWLVKRVGSLQGDRIAVTSDNSDAGAVDSAVFGPVERRGSYLVAVRVPVRWMGGAPGRSAHR